MEGGFNQRGRTTSLERWIGETIETMRMGTLSNEMVVCAFTASGAPMEFVVDLLESTTGESFSGDGLRACADRDYLLRYAFNLRMGHAPADNVLPKRIVRQMEKADGRWVEDWPLVASSYYELRGFDEEGYPTEEALRVAGLDDVVADMYLWVR
jgi:aldehyde:ferredoxin oxidoreductase